MQLTQKIIIPKYLYFSRPAEINSFFIYGAVKIHFFWEIFLQNQSYCIILRSMKTLETYQGFEQGPIRPPSEAGSLLIRITRNCPWNRCTFCPVYKGQEFSLRDVDHVIKDIDAIHEHVERLRSLAGTNGQISRGAISKALMGLSSDEQMAFSAAFQWLRGGMTSIFLQDANSLILKPADLIRVLRHIRERFPWTQRITSYARSHTIARISDEDLDEMAQAGLNRIHIGLESGSDEVLKFVKKGADKATHIKAGIKVKKARMELSEYVMPGLGGKKLSEVHALETADALNQINPDFIRLRTLAMPSNISLYDDYASGDFETLTDIEASNEIRLFISSLEGITSQIKSDHILNLFEEIDGHLPEHKDAMIGVIDKFLQMSPEEQCLYQVGRRSGAFSRLSEMSNPEARARAEELIKRFDVNPENVNEVITDLMTRFI